jgi:hypothetical protein
VRTNVAALAPQPTVDNLAIALTGGNLSAQTRTTIAAQKSLPKIAGLILGSPEFQRQ